MKLNIQRGWALACLVLAGCGGGADEAPATMRTMAAQPASGSATMEAILPAEEGQERVTRMGTTSTRAATMPAAGAAALMARMSAQPAEQPRAKALAVNATSANSTTDLLWHNASSGQTVTWAMDGPVAKSSTTLLQSTDWKITRSLDLNGDGQQDYIWENAATSQIVAWTMNGSQTLDSKVLLQSPGWKLIQSADFNGDGRDDLLFSNAQTGQTVIWLMDGTTVVSSKVLFTSTVWQVAFVGDFNGDGMADLVWRNSQMGQTAVWLMNGSTVLSNAVLLDLASWQVTHVADFNGDGKDDLLWHNAATGQTVLWLMDGLTASSSTTLFTHASWKVALTADLDGDRRADLIWVNAATSETAGWLMKGATVKGNATLLAIPGWQVELVADLNGDGKQDLLWRDAASGQTVAWLMDGLSIASQSTLLYSPAWKPTLIKRNSLLAARAWTAGQMLETDDNHVLSATGGIDDAGRVTVLFVKLNGTRSVLYATRGTPGAANVAPSYSTPVALDNDANIDTSYEYGVNTSSNGNAVAYWHALAPCSASTYKTSGSCRFLVTSRFLASNGSWESPIAIADVPRASLGAQINQAGDIVVELPSWNRSGTTSYVDVAGVAWRAVGQAGFDKKQLPTLTIVGIVGIDGLGNFVVAGVGSQDLTTVDVVAHRGSVKTGVGAMEVLDTRGAKASFESLTVGEKGQAVVVWTQDNGVQNSRWAASLDKPGGTWTVNDWNVSTQFSTKPVITTITDSGEFIWVSWGRCTQVRRTGGEWSGEKALPNGMCKVIAEPAMSRNGNMLAVESGGRVATTGNNTGRWLTYDDSLGRALGTYPGGNATSGSGFVYGVKSKAEGTWLLSNSGVGFYLSVNNFDVLPTAAAPNGDGRVIKNLWGNYFK